jgi:hypothetical protein
MPVEFLTGKEFLAQFEVQVLKETVTQLIWDRHDRHDTPPPLPSGRGGSWSGHTARGRMRSEAGSGLHLPPPPPGGYAWGGEARFVLKSGHVTWPSLEILGMSGRPCTLVC